MIQTLLALFLRNTVVQKFAFDDLYWKKYVQW